MKNFTAFVLSTALAALAAFATEAADASISVTRGTSKTRSSGPAGLSGITYAGGSSYYVVADNGSDNGLYPMTISLASDGSSVSSCSVGSRQALAMVTDIEAVAYDPATGNIWAACEGTQTITEFDPATGAALRRVDLPAVLAKANIYANYGFESLTISGDGLTMWTANEEALQIDGARSSYSAGTTVRLVRFDRETVHDDWRLTAMYPYTTDRWNQLYNYGGAGRRGVSDLCALPDGTLLVMEREMSSDSDGTGIWAKLGAQFYITIYRITTAAMATATDVKDNTAGLLNTSGWASIAKTQVCNYTTMYYSNCEGICLGPRLNGGALSILLVTDAGDGNTDKEIIPLTMSGLNVRTFSFGSPAIGKATFEGSNFRLMNGAEVEVSLCGEGVDPVAYTNEGVVCVSSASWTLPAHNPSSGQGLKARFTVAADDTLSWNVATGTASTGLLLRDSFEEYAAGTPADSVEGWSGDGYVIVTNYPAPVAGYPLGREAHTKVLKPDGDTLTRTFSAESRPKVKYEAMFEIVRCREGQAVNTDGVQLAGCVDSEGHFTIRHLTKDGELVITTFSGEAFDDGDWVRVGFEIDYATDPAGHAYFRAWINGHLCRTPAGYETPGGRAGGGVWHRALSDAGMDGMGRISSVQVVGDCGIDDSVMAMDSWVSEGIDDAKVGGVPANWFDEHGYARTPGATAPGRLGSQFGYTLSDVYAAGIRPEDDEPLKVTGMAVDGDQLTLEFNAVKVAPDTEFSVYWSSSLAPAGFTEVLTGSNEFEEDRGEWRTTWSGAMPSGPGGFYYIKATR